MDKELTAEDLHDWYLEITARLKPESYNIEAQKPYSLLSDEQQSIDKYILDNFMSWHKAECKRFALELIGEDDDPMNIDLYKNPFAQYQVERMMARNGLRAELREKAEEQSK